MSIASDRQVNNAKCFSSCALIYLRHPGAFSHVRHYTGSDRQIDCSQATNKEDQRFSPRERYATGLRNGEGFAFDSGEPPTKRL